MATLETRPTADGTPSWRVTWVLGGGRYVPGKTKASETFYALDGSQGAVAFKADVEANGHQWPKGWIKGQGYVANDASKPTFHTVADAFFALQDRRVTRGRIAARTVYKYKRITALHLDGHFASLPYADISREDIEDWVDAMRDEGWSPKSIRNWHGVLHSIMAHGQERMELRHGNPCAGTDLPKETEDKRHLRFFQEDEWHVFRRYLKEDVLLLVDVLIMTGMRWGEVSALQVDDVTFKDNGDVVLYIQRAWSNRAPDDPEPVRPEMSETNTWKLGPTKNKKKRRVVLHGEVADRLREAVADRDGSGWLFHTRSGAPWRYDDFHYDRWSKARKLAHVVGLEKRFTPHMLRHTAVVWSLADGVPIEKISAMLGHASIQITYDVYGGLLDLTDPEMAQTMAKRMAGTSVIKEVA